MDALTEVPAVVIETHPKFTAFQLVSHLDVDAGSIWVGDGCYVLKDADEPRPQDLGDDWHGICSRFFSRSGYDEAQREYAIWSESWRDSWYSSDEFEALVTSFPERPEGYRFDRDKPDDQKSDYDRHFERMNQETKAFRDRYREAHPFTPTAVDRGFANFTHDAGHGGIGTMISTYYGDGTYPVYIEYGENGRPRRVLIDFDPGAETEDAG